MAWKKNPWRVGAWVFAVPWRLVQRLWQPAVCIVCGKVRLSASTADDMRCHVCSGVDRLYKVWSDYDEADDEAAAKVSQRGARPR